MLPWRRSKFVLAEDECQSKPKSVSVRSLLCAVLRSCPDLLPDPFPRLGSVFRSRRQTVELNAEEPSYSVRYLGSAVTVLGRGEEAEEAVAQIWSHSGYGQQSARMKLSVGPHGIRMGDRRRPAQLYSLHRITYCAPDPVRPKICAWIYRHQVKNKAVVLRCHAVLLPRAEKAQALALSLSQTSTSAFSEFKRLKRQSDARHRQQQRLGHGIVPLMPLRRRLNGQCHYQPAERPGSTTRLCSITEEEEEQEGRGEELSEEDKEQREMQKEEDAPLSTNTPLPRPQENLGTVANRLDAV